MKYFIISDIHSFYNEMKDALDHSGYDYKNPKHTLIVCGDIFDRGDQSKEVLKFLKSIPKNRRILIRGNHEYLLKDAIQELNRIDLTNIFLGDGVSKHHYSNGTIKSICHLLDVEYNGYWGTDLLKIIRAENKKHLIHKTINWIMSDDWVDYYELNNLVFVHCWIPVINHDNLPMYYINDRHFDFDPDWKIRPSHGPEWQDATWGCPYKLRDMKLGPDNKTIVCGHWHTADMHQIYENQEDNYEIYFSKDLIGLDACTARTGFCNVLVIDEQGNIFDQHGNKRTILFNK